MLVSRQPCVAAPNAASDTPFEIARQVRRAVWRRCRTGVLGVTESDGDSVSIEGSRDSVSVEGKSSLDSVSRWKGRQVGSKLAARLPGRWCPVDGRSAERSPHARRGGCEGLRCMGSWRGGGPMRGCVARIWVPREAKVSTVKEMFYATMRGRGGAGARDGPTDRLTDWQSCWSC